MASDKVQKDLNYTAYEKGIEEGKALIAENYVDSNDDDVMWLLDDVWPSRSREHFEDIDDDGTFDEVMGLIKNYLDGIEDGVKSALGRWLKKERQRLFDG